MPEEKTAETPDRAPAPPPAPLDEEPVAMPMPHEPGDENAQPG